MIGLYYPLKQLITGQLVKKLDIKKVAQIVGYRAQEKPYPKK